MAFGDIASHIIIFIAVVSITTVVVVAMKGYVDSTTNSISEQQQRVANQIETEITIEVLLYVNETGGNYT